MSEDHPEELHCIHDDVNVPADDPQCFHPSSFCEWRELCEVIEAIRKRKRSKETSDS